MRKEEKCEVYRNTSASPHRPEELSFIKFFSTAGSSRTNLLNDPSLKFSPEIIQLSFTAHWTFNILTEPKVSVVPEQRWQWSTSQIPSPPTLSEISRLPLHGIRPCSLRLTGLPASFPASFPATFPASAEESVQEALSPSVHMSSGTPGLVLWNTVHFLDASRGSIYTSEEEDF